MRLAWTKGRCSTIHVTFLSDSTPSASILPSWRTLSTGGTVFHYVRSLTGSGMGPRGLEFLLLALLLGCSGNAAQITKTKRRTKDEEQQSTFSQQLDSAVDTLNEAFENISDSYRQAQETFQEKVDDLVEDVQELIGIERVERRLVKAIKKTGLLRRILLRGIVGSGLLFYGLHFSHLVVFTHTVRQSALPYIARSFNETVDIYRNARQTIKREYPNLKQTRELLDAVKYEMAATRKILKQAKAAAKDGIVTDREALTAVRRAQVNLHELNRKSATINQSLSSWAAVAGAVDFSKVRELLKGLYTSMLACMATASSSSLRGLSIGFDLASLVSRHLSTFGQLIMEQIPRLEVLKVMPPETQKVLSLVLSAVSLVKSQLVVTWLMPRMTLTISSSALGAAWLTDMLVDVSDDCVAEKGRGIMNDKVLYLLSNVGLTLIGIAFQTSDKSDVLPAVVEKILYPALRLEHFLRSLDGLFSVGKDRLQNLLLRRVAKVTSDPLSTAAAAPKTPPAAEYKQKQQREAKKAPKAA